MIAAFCPTPQLFTMPLTVPPYSFYKVPKPHEMADKLVLAILEEERDEARGLLIQNILPVKLAAIDHHPRPQRLTAVVYREIAGLLSGKPPNMRLYALRLFAFDVFIQYMTREALNLAVTRFILDRPELADRDLGHWRSTQVKELLRLTAADITDIAERALDSVDQWKRGMVDGYPAEWGRHKDVHEQVHDTLHSAATGQFEGASGPLYDFLCQCEQAPERL